MAHPYRSNPLHKAVEAVLARKALTPASSRAEGLQAALYIRAKAYGISQETFESEPGNRLPIRRSQCATTHCFAPT